MDTPANASAELVELGEAETFSVFNEHDGCIRDVDAYFDDGGGDKGLRVAEAKLLHDGVFLLRRNTPVEERARHGCQEGLPLLKFGGCGFGFGFFGSVDERVDDVGLSSGFEMFADKLGGFGYFCAVPDAGDYFSTALWKFVESRNIQITVQAHCERSGDGCGGHDEHVRATALGA